jgi:hypothetical protein
MLRNVGYHESWKNKATKIGSVQSSSEAHPASYPMGTGGPFPGGKAQPWRDADNSPHLVQGLRMSRSYTSSLLWCLIGVTGQL